MSIITKTGRRACARTHGGFTMLELLVAAALTLLMTALVVQVFGFVSDGVFNSRANISVSEQLRNTKQRLIQDLRGATAPTIPPLDPFADLGYFEYVEGPQVATDGNGDSGFSTNSMLTIAGDSDDILMFTTAGLEEQFVGKGSGVAAKSRYAEVAWFLRQTYSQATDTRRGTMQNMGELHRRVFLVDNRRLFGSSYNVADQSIRQLGGLYEPNAQAPHQSRPSPSAPTMDANSLGDLTMRERRSLHQPYVWPFEMMYMTGGDVTGVAALVKQSWQAGIIETWNPSRTAPNYSLSLPLLSSVSGPTADSITVTSKAYYQTQAGSTGTPDPFIAPTSSSTREADDVILTNVIGFDVKAWDPGAPVFRATAVGGSGSLGVVVPGDAGYSFGSDRTKPDGALQRFINGSISGKNTSGEPVSFGAYADLNYMWMWGETGTQNEFRRNSYYRALAGYEIQLAPTNGGIAQLPRPSFAFATRGRALSGFPKDEDPLTPGKPMYTAFPAVYDTWSRHYEFDGRNNDDDSGPAGVPDGIIDPGWPNSDPTTNQPYYDYVDEGTNGIDDNGNGFIDEPPIPSDLDNDGLISAQEIWWAEWHAERDASPPYDAPLRGIKITIRVFEQDSKQIREISVVHEFVPL